MPPMPLGYVAVDSASGWHLGGLEPRCRPKGHLASNFSKFEMLHCGVLSQQEVIFHIFLGHEVARAHLGICLVYRNSCEVKPL